MKQFLLSDESLNSYGFKVLTRGINLRNFERNPVMYYNHDREAGVIGKWTNLHVKKNKLFGTPVFDENDSLGAKIAGKVKDGFVRAASIGADNINLQDVNGEFVVVSCDLLEISICDIPSNKNALMLYVDDRPVTDKDEILKLCKNQPNMKTDLKPITDALGLKPGASIEDIVAAIKQLKNNDSPQSIIENAIKMNLIAGYERDELLQLAKASPSAFMKYMDKRKEIIVHEREEEGLKLTNQAFRDGRLDCDADGKIRAFWLKSFSIDFDGTKAALEYLPKRISIAERIGQQSSMDGRENWTLADYRKKAPLELKNNPDLYRQLVEQEQLKTKQ